MSYPIAINIAFTPEPMAYECLLGISQRLSGEQGSPYCLGIDGEPHLTLLQGVVAAEESLHALQDQLATLVNQESFPELIGEGFWQSDSGRSLWWKVKATTALRQWHDRVVELAKPHLWAKAEPVANMFANPAQVRHSDCEWVRHYMDQASGDQFMPHFTLGYGQTPAGAGIPESMRPGALGLFQLGPYCSCYLPIAKWLKGGPAQKMQ